MSTKTTIPEHYRQWAKQEAEREYPRKMWPEGTLDEVRRQRKGYEAALLRMWPLMEHSVRIIEAYNDKLVQAHTPIAYLRHMGKLDEALSSLNLPQP